VRTLYVLTVVAVLATTAWAKVWPVVLRYDGKTPLEVVDPNDPTIFRDIMIGTRLAIVIRSDRSEGFSGSLSMTWEDAVYGDLVARGTPDVFWNYPNSTLYDAGSDACTWLMDDFVSHGFQFTNTYAPMPDPRLRYAVAGDWFIVDYYALQVGLCQVDFYNWEMDLYVPQATLLFRHVPTRDFNADRIVDLNDFAILAAHWRCPVDANPNTPDAAFDFDADRRIDVNDLVFFNKFWLERSDTPLADDPDQK